ncbi:hypothetical protein PQC39_gp061 [Vibrio phage Vp_R1]|uniref:Uncharacterized protein n=1 Tax=Vibrio phage Vp_R1 TaxID=2059867 RepID=A0A2H5BQ36_9CAUD|nr:hypothetical protein PQC39_gp061 [Vibrio phage Vp_R1]AUG88425.1 hypothetical protein VPR_061 [Vibrio phage Vp_R1]
MPKLLAREHITEVLGEEEAETHLKLVEEDQKVKYGSDLTLAFVWGTTPQGHDFWSAVYKAIPHGYVV